jgi:CRISPR-associated Csx2 family protein
VDRSKILILTLGTGDLDKAKEDAGYKMTQYTIEGLPYKKQGAEKTTSFVAEPIIDYFKPDIIFILGTVKSVWHQFYAAVTTKDSDDKSYSSDANYKRLVEIETQNGISTDSNRIKLIQKEITDIFEEIKNWEKYSEKYKNQIPEIHILLTKYGINSEELKENYGILKSIENYLKEGSAYEVAFDITHSFRSLPVYNLVIFNYIKNVTKYDIVISHIYYGNIDARHELGGKAPIVDLKDLVDVLNLTNGVTEFKNTGNAISLLSLVDTKDELRNKLRDFDFATQLNDFGDIRSSLNALENIVDCPAFEDRYTGVREMIKAVLQEKFKMGSETSFDCFSDVDLKFMLTGWFFNQNRMGLGLATGLEALRDINTPAFMEARGDISGEERKYRESAEGYFMQEAEQLFERPWNKLSSLEQAVCLMGTKLSRYKDIRNMFAHSLNKKLSDTPSEIRDEIEEFRENLLKLKSEYEADRNAYKSLFKPNKQKKEAKSSNSSCRILLEFGERHFYNHYQSSASKIKYDVYYLSFEAKRLFLNRNDSRQNPTYESAYFLAKYLKDHIPDNYENVQIVLLDCVDIEKEIIYRAFLEQICNQDLRVQLLHNANNRLGSCKRTQLRIAINDYQNELAEKDFEYAKVMENQLMQYKEENEIVQDNQN